MKELIIRMKREEVGFTLNRNNEFSYQQSLPTFNKATLFSFIRRNSVRTRRLKIRTKGQQTNWDLQKKKNTIFFSN